MAWIFAALWFGGLSLLFRVAPLPAPLPREIPARVAWWPMDLRAPALDVRAHWTPSAFALSTPAGFSHSLRRERAGIAPPVQAAPPEAAYLGRPRPASSFDLSPVGHGRLASAATSEESAPSAGVFPQRTPSLEPPRMDFSTGWEPRLFSGIDLDFGAWTNIAWEARVEMRFDEKGIPLSILLAQASGMPEVDRRLARSASGWRLLEPSAPRAGTVAWSAPVSKGEEGAGP